MRRVLRQSDLHHASRRAAAACRDRVRSQKSPTPDALRGSPTPLRPASFVLHTFLLVSLIVSGWPPVVQAGDILRGGATTSGGGRKNAEARQSAGADAAALAKTKAADRLARTTKAVTDMRNLQEAARNAAGAGGVPDGLTPGGLRVATGANAKWTGALAPVQNGSNVNITQTQSQALLHWETFNVGKNTTVNFDQKAGGNDSGKWIAFNKVFDPSGVPSQIRGKINADGQVYIINQNGIIFGAGSQVNARTLVASSLPINDNLIERGLLNQQAGGPEYLFSALPTGTFSPQPRASGNIIVERGATISSPVTADGYGGRVMLVGSSVQNSGSIFTPGGQTILAAGLQVGVEASSDATLRGLVTYVGAVPSDSLGVISAHSVNDGIIDAPRGAITMTGRRVTQGGILESSTSVDLNGRIDLIASYDSVANAAYDPSSGVSTSPFLQRATGLVEALAGSVTRILPEYSSEKTIARTDLLLRSQINILGRNIYLGQGSLLFAPNALVTLQAGEWIYRPAAVPPSSLFVYSTGQIYMDKGSILDVSGSPDVFVPLSHSILKVQLRGAELSDSPLQRTGNLRGVDLVVDIRKLGAYDGKDWTGTPLGDVSGYLNLIERNVAQLTTQGGEITMQAGGSVVIQSGSVIDSSGGYIRSGGGRVQTTRLRRGSQIVDIDNAFPDRLYDGLYDGMTSTSSLKWGVSRTYKNALAPVGGHNEQETIFGADAGKLSITAPTMVLDGELTGNAIIGPKQLRTTALSSTLPKGGDLELIFEAQDKSILNPLFPKISPQAPRIVFSSSGSLPQAESFSVDSQGNAAPVSASRTSEFVLSPAKLSEAGIQSLSVVNSDGDILIPAGENLQFAPTGKLNLDGRNIDIAGNISIPGGEIALVASNYSPYRATILRVTTGARLPSPSSSRGTITVRSGSVISAAVPIVDDRETTLQAMALPILTKAGSIGLEAFSIDLQKSSLLDVSGSMAVGSNGKTSFSDAGSISILAGQDPFLPSIIGGNLVMDGEVRGFSANEGGSGALSIKANTIQVGGPAPQVGAFHLLPEFFNSGGFGRFTLTGIGARSSGTSADIPAVLISAGTAIEPVVQSYEYKKFTSASSGSASLKPSIKPVGLRDPVTLTFEATGAFDSFSSSIVAVGMVDMKEGSLIRTDPGGQVHFVGQSVSINGFVSAPGGEISVTGATRFPELTPGPVALPTVLLGKSARLSVAGTQVYTPDPYGRLRGKILPGGSIEVAGNIVAESGAVLDVSGSTGLLDLTPQEAGARLTSTVTPRSGLTAPLSSRQTIRQQVDSNGGTISLEGSTLLITDATLLGSAGGPTAIGGFLSISTGNYVEAGEASTTEDINLSVRQTGTFLSASGQQIGKPVIAADGKTIKGGGQFAVEKFSNGGFSSLELGGNIAFKGPVDITATGALLIAGGGIVEADDVVTLKAPYIRLGQDFRLPEIVQTQPYFEKTDVSGITTPHSPVPTFGPGSLQITASLIDVGTTVLKNISTAALHAEGGDIRGSGTFLMAGDLTLQSGQIYPTTLGEFNIIAYDRGLTPGSITILPSGTRALPYSVGGSLNVMASAIRHYGTLRAPHGGIALGWDGLGTSPTNPIAGGSLGTPATNLLVLGSGSVTSVSGVDPTTGEGLLLPFGFTSDGLSWTDPAGRAVTLRDLPSKAITLGARNIQMQEDSLIDISGGGDLIAYRWIKGNTGSKDLLASEDSFAVLPAYQFSYAPFAPFSSTIEDDKGYVNGNLGLDYSGSRQLGVGDQINLAGSDALPAGKYTLLPAKYALLPGAVLVTPRDGRLYGSVKREDGVNLVSGYVSNSIAQGKGASRVRSTFQVLTPEALSERAEYRTITANSFMAEAAAKRNQETQRLPMDSGRLVFSARTGLVLEGKVAARPAPTGRGADIDVVADGNIWITDGNGSPAGTIELKASRLSSFGAQSLLIGGRRSASGNQASISVRTTSVTLDNRSIAFQSPEIILAATDTLTLASESSIESVGSQVGGAGTMTLSGPGTLVRVSAVAQASTIRTGGPFVSTIPRLTVGAGVRIAGEGITLDSTYDMSLNPTAQLVARGITLSSGRISVVLDNPGTILAGNYGLVLSGTALRTFAQADYRTLNSYSFMDFYGTGSLGVYGRGLLTLRAAEIRGVNQGAGSVLIGADEIRIGNNSAGLPSGIVAPAQGSMRFEASTFRLGENLVQVNRYADVVINADRVLTGDGTGGLSTQQNLSIFSPLVTGARGSTQTIQAGGHLSLASTGGAASFADVGLGASLALLGTSVHSNTSIVLPAGSLSVTASAGDLSIGGELDVSGRQLIFYDVPRYADAGEIRLEATLGNLRLLPASRVSVAAHTGGGDAGKLEIYAPNGIAALDGQLFGSSREGYDSGSFSIDVNMLPLVSPLSILLDAGSFRNERTFRVRNGTVTVDGAFRTRSFSLTTDNQAGIAGMGSIVVSGTIDASGPNGGRISLIANRDVTLLAGSRLTVFGQEFSNSGKGGSIQIEAGSQTNGIVGSGSVKVQAGSLLDLRVASFIPGSASQVGSSAFYGNFQGTLHLRAPQNAAGNDLMVDPVQGTILGASSIRLEGYRLFDLTATNGTITNSGATVNPLGGLITAATNVQESIRQNAISFVGSTTGAAAAGYGAMLARLLGADTQGLLPIFVVAPGAELIKRNGDLVLGALASTQTSDWNLSGYRFGLKQSPGVLTLKASGSIILHNALSDGFAPTLPSSNTSWLWLAPLMAQNTSSAAATSLPVNLQSWSYRITSGADMMSANYSSTLSLSSLASGSGSLLLGKNSGSAASVGAANATTASVIANRFQVIRTGAGSIEISAGRSVQFLNPFASIYTAGTQVAAASTIYSANDFVVPTMPSRNQGSLGAVQQLYPAQYSFGGGNISVKAGENIERKTRNNSGLIDDSSRQMPNNWLYRRGYVDGAGNAGEIRLGNVFNSYVDPAASTTWWVDFSNFFQGVGALGGGDISLVAGTDVKNVDAVIPTVARAPRGRAADTLLLEYGGGDLQVSSGRDINGGVYYVERGEGVLTAGSSLVTNSTRSPSTGLVTSLNNPSQATLQDSSAWLPTTLFVGKGQFEIQARKDILLGPVANPFLLPQGLNNRYWYKTFFSTYSPESSVKVTSLGGNVSMRNSINLPTQNSSRPALEVWLQTQQLLSTGSGSAAYYQPWLRLVETSLQPFTSILSVYPSNLEVSALSGNVNLVGDFTLFPAPNGQLEIVASGSIDGLQTTGTSNTRISGQSVKLWTAASINVSDANPNSIPTQVTPLSAITFAGVGLSEARLRETQANSLSSISRLFTESGSVTGTFAQIQTKTALHDSSILHRNDSTPLRLYASDGSISGLTLFSPKFSRIVADKDIQDVAFYLQNTRDNDITLVSAGRDILLYDEASPARVQSGSTGNALSFGQLALQGDIQIGGKGSLHVVAGRDFDLGVGPPRSDGTGVGVTSVGNFRNIFLPFEGASIFIGAGVDATNGLGGGNMRVDEFLDMYYSEYADQVEIASSPELLSPDHRAELALRILPLILRDTGRSAEAEGSYQLGFDAISLLFGTATVRPIIDTRSRDVRTRSGGEINIFAPRGSMAIAETLFDPDAQPGILTEYGGRISILMDGDVSIGLGRIFTLRGGDIVIWSSSGDIAAGVASKTVKAAPPTRVLVDSVSAAVETDLAGLFTGGGIGVLSTVAGVPKGDVDLIAPIGTVDAGDAGIRASGNLNISAVQVLNADNISVGGSSSGVPSAPVTAAPNVAGLSSGSTSSAASNTAASSVANQASQPNQQEIESPSVISVEVLGYGGGDEDIN